MNNEYIIHKKQVVLHDLYKQEQQTRLKFSQEVVSRQQFNQQH